MKVRRGETGRVNEKQTDVTLKLRGAEAYTRVHPEVGNMSNS